MKYIQALTSEDTFVEIVTDTVIYVIIKWNFGPVGIAHF